MNTKRYLVIGAHPDDPDLVFGGCAIKLARLGHSVKFVSCCNGDAGHYSMERKALAERRKNEALSSAAVAGLSEYQVLDYSDCELMPTLEARRRITGIIRAFQPDVVISHRPFDYHADHRAAGQIVQDSAYLVTVPLFCPEHPIPTVNPVYLYAFDRFTKPCPFTPDIAIAIDDVVPDKIRMLDCHVSQFYEWLPYNQGRLDQVPKTAEGRSRFLIDGWLCRNRTQAERNRDRLEAKYGTRVHYAETFELSEYGRSPAPEELEPLFPL